MQSFKDFARQFFIKNSKKLESNYPGITFRRFIDDLQLLNSNKDLSNLPYSGLVEKEFESVWSDLRLGRPLEYITNRAFFYKSEFYVDERVLIPRFETELLVEKASLFAKKNEFNNLVEIGVGSGAILISLLQELPTPVNYTGIDISVDALEVANFNLNKLKYTFSSNHQGRLVEGDRLCNFHDKVQLIVSNPPYIPQGDETVHSQVHLFEPHLALYLPENEYMKWHKKFFMQVNDCLEKNGLFLMEGHEKYLCKLAKILEIFDFTSVSIEQDYCERNRFLMARK
ncbi:MAG: N5-glutamine methyltransferase family protein [Bacteriovoracia bacterium]